MLVKSLWQWDELSDTVSARYQEYARANAWLVSTGQYLTMSTLRLKPFPANTLKGVRVFADIFRPYGNKVYLRSTLLPMQLGGWYSADPLNE